MQKKIAILLAILIFGFAAQNLFAGGSLVGASGVILTPNANFPVDRQIRFGIGKINAPYAFIDGPEVSQNYLFYASLVYLPRVEITVLITSAPGRTGNDGSNVYKDAAVFVQFYVLNETEHLPAVAVGAYDFYSFSFYNALFMVLSKNMKVGLPHPITFSLGYGVDWIDKHSGDTAEDRNAPVPHHLIGLFGSVELAINKQFSVILEQDSRKFNSGVQVKLFKHFVFLGSFLNFSTFSGNLNFQFQI